MLSGSTLATFAVETPLPTVPFEDLALASTRSAGNTGVRAQVPRRQPGGSWLRILDRPEVPQPWQQQVRRPHSGNAASGFLLAASRGTGK